VRSTGCLGAALAAAVVLSTAQTTAPTTTFRAYQFGREIGRETDVVSVDGGTRRFASTYVTRDRIGELTLTGTLETALDATPQRLTLTGSVDRETSIDLDVSVNGRRAQLRNRGVFDAIDLPADTVALLDGGVPALFEEQLIRYWRVQGRPAELPVAGGGVLRIARRADEQFDIAGRVVTLERLAIDGPDWGNQTAWVDASGTLDVLMTSVQGRQVALIRSGFESRLQRFVTQHSRDRLADYERLSASTLPDFSHGVALVGGTVLTDAKRPPLTDAVVVLRGDRIQAVGAAARTKLPADLPKIDARGLTIIPGLWDFHGRISQPQLAAAYLSAGVTTVVHATPDDGFLEGVRDANADSHLLIPRLFQSGVIDGLNGYGPVQAVAADEARQAVRRYRGDDMRFVEIGTSFSGSLLRTTASEAHRSFLQIGGAIPAGLTAEQAIEAGLDQFHSLGEVDLTSGQKAFIAAAAKRRAAFIPTLGWRELLQRPGATSLDTLDAAIRGFPPAVVRSLSAVSSTTDRAPWHDTIAAAHAAGVPLLAGTNGVLAGVGLHHELELLVRAGLSPAQALETATSAAAQAAHVDDSGVIASGKRADLVALSGNPLEDISRVRSIRWVVANGKIYDPAKLRKAAGFGN
jgi:hypothetical protein